MMKKKHFLERGWTLSYQKEDANIFKRKIAKVNLSSYHQLCITIVCLFPIQGNSIKH